MKNEKRSKPDQNEEEAKRILDRVARESETVASSTMARTGEQFKKNVGNSDDDNDAIEILGKKIGRSLGWLALAALAYYMLQTYVF